MPAGDDYVWVAVSPTEPLIAVSAVYRRARPNPSYRVFLWNITTRQKLLDLPVDQFCGRLMFSGDGQQLITATNELALWRVSDGKKLSAIPLSPSSWRAGLHTPIAATADFAVAAHVAQGRDIRVVDLSTGQVKWQKTATRDRITALAFSPDGKILASGAGFQESAIRLWEVSSGREIARLDGHRTFVRDLVFWPDGKKLASASADQTIRVWDVESHRLAETWRGHKLEVWSLALLANGRMLASGCKDGSVYLWDTAVTRGRGGFIALSKPTVTWRATDDNASVIIVDPQGLVEEWTGARFGNKSVLADLGRCTDAFFSPDGAAIVTKWGNGFPQIWDWAWQRQSAELRVRLDPIALVAGGKKLIGASGPPYWSQVGEWIVATGERTRSWNVPLFRSDRGAAVSPDEHWLFIGSLDSGYKLVDLKTGGIAATSEFGSRGPAFSPDSSLVAIPSVRDGRISVLDLKAGREIVQLDGFLQGAHSAAFSPDGRRLAVTGGGAEAIKIWDMASFETLITLEAEGSTSRTNSSFSASGDILGAYFGDQILHVWRAPSWSEIETAERATAQHRWP